MNTPSDRTPICNNICIIMMNDLGLLGSLYLAHFIVWRTLRTKRKERAVRLKNLRLIEGGANLPIIVKG
jgi:hypothetical protein